MEFLEVPLFDDDLFKLLARFSINAFFLTIIMKFAIYPNLRQREFAFTAVMMNITVFFICFALKKLDLGLGMALGLFAIFGVLRYRTDAIRVKEMTYLFIVIGIAVINSLSNKNTSYAEVLAVNLLIISIAVLKERITCSKPASGVKPVPKKSAVKKEDKFVIEYDRLELLGVEHRSQLLADITARTSIVASRVQIKNINLTTNSATLSIWCAQSVVDNKSDTSD
ncbi:MAG: DUF4956 domain-containing protein [Fuerstiella sp.]